MERTVKKWIKGLLIAALLGSCSISFAQETQEVLLCGEDETFFIAKIDGGEEASLVYEYDCRGNCVGSSWKYVNGWPPEHGFIACEDTYDDTEMLSEKEKDLLEAKGFDREKIYGVRYRNYPGLFWSLYSTASYIVSGDLCTLALGEEVMEVRFPQEELRPEVFNEEVTVVRGHDMGAADGFWIIENETGEVLARLDEHTCMNVRLGDGYCTFTEVLHNEAGYAEWHSRVIDYYGKDLFETKSDLCMAWKNGLVYIERGPYRGLVDLKGEWVFKVMEEER